MSDEEKQKPMETNKWGLLIGGIVIASVVIIMLYLTFASPIEEPIIDEPLDKEELLSLDIVITDPIDCIDSDEDGICDSEVVNPEE